MPLFGRKKEPLIPMPAFALTPNGWVPFTAAVGALWEVIAATAWEGYRSSGRGCVNVDFDTDSVNFIPIEEFTTFYRERYGNDPHDLQHLCSRYKPDREVILMTRGARDAKAARAGENEAYTGVLPTPEGLHDPSVAYELHRSKKAGREYITALSRQRKQQHAQRQQKGIDPNAV